MAADGGRVVSDLNKQLGLFTWCDWADHHRFLTACHKSKAKHWVSSHLHLPRHWWHELVPVQTNLLQGAALGDVTERGGRKVFKEKQISFPFKPYAVFVVSVWTTKMPNGTFLYILIATFLQRHLFSVISYVFRRFYLESRYKLNTGDLTNTWNHLVCSQNRWLTRLGEKIPSFI